MVTLLPGAVPPLAVLQQSICRNAGISLHAGDFKTLYICFVPSGTFNLKVGLEEEYLARNLKLTVRIKLNVLNKLVVCGRVHKIVIVQQLIFKNTEL